MLLFSNKRIIKLYQSITFFLLAFLKGSQWKDFARVGLTTDQEAVCVLAAQSCWTIDMNLFRFSVTSTFCSPLDCSPPGSSVHGILQARILEWVAMPFSRGSSQTRDRTWVSCIVGRFSTS